MIKSIEKSVFSAIVLAVVFQMIPASNAQMVQAATAIENLASHIAIDQSVDLPPIDSTDVVDPPVYTVQEVLLAVCESRGYGEDCAKTLLGMIWTESSNRYNVVGDNGRARGYYQIHYRLHGITTDCAEDIVCSSQWTIDYLERNAYPKYVNYAVQCHNGCNAWNGYTTKVTRYGNYFWNQPLEITQTVPVVLPEVENVTQEI